MGSVHSTHKYINHQFIKFHIFSNFYGFFFKFAQICLAETGIITYAFSKEKVRSMCRTDTEEFMNKKVIPKIQELFIFNLRSIRNSRNFSQKQLADKLSISTVHLNNIENGKTFPSVNLLNSLCLTLEVKPFELFK